MKSKRYKSIKEFYPYYLSEHSKPATKALHFIGTLLSLMCLFFSIAIQAPWFLLLALVNGYLFAWVSHFLIEKNRPATFSYPVLSFICDFKMFFEILTGRLKL